jgi:DNA polymerase III delta subunit
MLFSYFGSDWKAVRAEKEKKISALREKGMTPTTLTEREGVDALREAVSATSLFGARELYVLDTPSEEADFFEMVLDMLPAFRESQNTFILREGSLTKTRADRVMKESTEYAHHDARGEKEFNIFGLTDALLRRDRKSLWVELVRAREAGKSSEDMIGTLWWQLKVLRLIARSESVHETGLKPFVYEKGRRALREYTRDDIERLSQELLLLYHRGHGGRENIDHALEAWVLRV